MHNVGYGFALLVANLCLAKAPTVRGHLVLFRVGMCVNRAAEVGTLESCVQSLRLR